MKKLQIFLIDDDYPTNVYNEIIVKQSALFDSYRIFDNANQALSDLTMKSEKPDIILVDINMPIVDGWDFIEALSQKVNAQSDQIKVVLMLTTSSSQLDLEKSQKYSLVKGIMEKPLTEEKLQEIVRNMN